MMILKRMKLPYLIAPLLGSTLLLSVGALVMHFSLIEPNWVNWRFLILLGLIQAVCLASLCPSHKRVLTSVSMMFLPTALLGLWIIVKSLLMWKVTLDPLNDLDVVIALGMIYPAVLLTEDYLTRK